MFPHVQFGCDLGERGGVHDTLAEIGQRSLGQIGEVAEHEVGDDPSEYRVTEELEAFVAGVPLVFGHPRAVAQRAPEQGRISEVVTQPLFERSEGQPTRSWT